MRAGHSITCPECGRSIEHKRQLLRSARRWRPAIVACVLATTSVLIHHHPPLTAATIVSYTPSDVLLRGEGVFGIGTPLEVRSEIRRRATGMQLNERQTRAYVRLLINDLRSDSVAGNAREALAQLSVLAWNHPEPLIEALDSTDSQQRRMAATALRDAAWDDDDPLVDRLLRLAVEDLRDDDLASNAKGARTFLARYVDRAKPWLLSALSSDDQQLRRHALALLQRAELDGAPLERMLRLNIRELACDRNERVAHSAFVYLLRHADAADPLLRMAMIEGDARQRLVSAAVAGCAGRVDLMEQAVPILVSHLADNRIQSDAVLAARALWGFGSDVLPLIEPHRQSKDEQQRQSVEYIVQRMTSDQSIASLQRRLPLARLTHGRIDALSYQPQSLRMPWMSDNPR